MTGPFNLFLHIEIMGEGHVTCIHKKTTNLKVDL